MMPILIRLTAVDQFEMKLVLRAFQDRERSEVEVGPRLLWRITVSGAVTPPKPRDPAL